MVSICGWKRTLADKTVYQNRAIDTSFDPPIFSLDSTLKASELSGQFIKVSKNNKSVPFLKPQRPYIKRVPTGLIWCAFKKYTSCAWDSPLKWKSEKLPKSLEDLEQYDCSLQEEIFGKLKFLFERFDIDNILHNEYFCFSSWFRSDSESEKTSQIFISFCRERVLFSAQQLCAKNCYCY